MKILKLARVASIGTAVLLFGLFVPAKTMAKDQVAIQGEFTTAFVFTSPPPLLTIHVTGDGWVSRLGETSCDTDSEIVDFTQQPLPTLTATFTLNAANGDKLVVEMNGVAIPAEDGSVTFDGALIFTGGTGRFIQATGTGEFHGAATPTSDTGGVGWFAIEGSVSSVGASKR